MQLFAPGKEVVLGRAEGGEGLRWGGGEEGRGHQEKLLGQNHANFKPNRGFLLQAEGVKYSNLGNCYFLPMNAPGKCIRHWRDLCLHDVNW
jgi:hypothetical protein